VAAGAAPPSYTPPMSPPPPAWPETLVWPNRYAGLGMPFARPWQGQGLPEPHWLCTSDSAAAELGWPADWWQAPGALDVFSAHAHWPGMAPVTTVYSGHQFGVWAGQLGDGRALLLGEVDTPHGPRELQLKGGGLTPYSRMGDGRAVLRSSIREFLCSEAMHGLGIPTTRALALVGSPLPVRRETVETAAIVTRTAPSFLRFGHFEHFSHHGQHEALRQLFEHVVATHFPELQGSAQPVLDLLSEVCRRTAELLADWQAVGFCHGVMNTDNMSILGLTIDYGPFGFLDAFDPGHVCNHSDEQGRYAFARQPQVAYWNLHALAQALVPLVSQGEQVDTEGLQAALSRYAEVFPVALMRRMRAKLGLVTEQEGDGALVDDLLRLLATHRVDYTILFRRLCRWTAQRDAVRDLFLDRPAFDAWAERYDARLAAEGSLAVEREARMLRANPKFVLRNHLAEQAIRQAEAGDPGEVRRLLGLLLAPYDEHPEHEADAGFPPDWAQTLSVSCSS